MSNFNIEAIGLQIASEVKVDKDGKATFSIRTIERIVSVRNDTIVAHLRTVNSQDGKISSKLAQSLVDKGFDVTGFSKTGVPDIADASIIEYYAFEAGIRCTQEAMFAFRSFAAAGIRFWAHKITGWRPDIQPDIDPIKLLDQYIEKQLPEAPSQWECRYPKIFWSELERLYGLKQGDKVCAAIIYNYIYCKFPPIVRDRLDEINPLIDGERKNRVHQHFDKTLLSCLLQTIDKVIKAIEVSEDKQEFKKLVKRINKWKIDAPTVQRLLNASH